MTRMTFDEEGIAQHRATQDRLRPQRQAKMVARVAARKPDITKAKYEAAMREKRARSQQA